MKKYISNLISNFGWDFPSESLTVTLIHLLLIVTICFVVYWITKTIILNRVHLFAAKTETKWDDLLIKEHFFKRLSGILPIAIIIYTVSSILENYKAIIPYLNSILETLLAVAFMRLIISFINALQNYLGTKEKYKDKPLQSYTQLTKIVIYIFFGIIIFSVLTGKTPMFFLTAMGAMSAILLLIFKDTILGFIGSIQLAANDMVRIGDWI